MSKLIYDSPAGWDWNFALPVGNGKLGAMVFGNPDREVLQLNEDSLWYGGPIDRINRDARPNLEEVRKLILSERIPEAEELLLQAFTGTPYSMRCYQPLGELEIAFKNITGELDSYERELDLDRAVVTVRRVFGKYKIKEEVIASYPQNAIIIKINSNDMPLDLNVDIGRSNFSDSAFHESGCVFFTGAQTGDDYRFCGGVTAVGDGEIKAVGQHLRCRGVKELTVYFTAATTYRESEPFAYVKNRLQTIRQIKYHELRNEHEIDYRALFSKTELVLDYDNELDNLTTDVRLARISEEDGDNGLIKTYFDYGRYLLISCSRPGSLPANLQGVWNYHMDPPWGAKYTININTQMNYWPAEMFGLGDCHMPLFALLKKLRVEGRKVAEEMYGCRGFCCHHNTNLWGDCAPQDKWIPATYWVMSVPWLCTHIWQHYEYTGDVDFLKDMYPVLKDSVLFFHDFIMEVNGQSVICPSVSPENTYILENGDKGSVCASSTMDTEILRDHLTQFLAAYEIVGDKDREFVERTEEILSKLPPIRIGKHGQIMEWLKDYDEAEPGHRHISQLYALHPSHQISPEKTPELAKACEATIARRLAHGGGHTGWSRAWILNMQARLNNADECYKNLIALFKKSTLKNLFDNHPPFQIDGNFGSVAAVGEMLLKADGDEVWLLPALPEQMGKGRVRDIYAPHGAAYSMSWEDGRLMEFSVKAFSLSYRATVHYKEKQFVLDMVKGECARFEIYESD